MLIYFWNQGLPKVFSAGLDLVKEVYQPDVKRLPSFWSCFQEMWLRLYGSRLATMAAINVRVSFCQLLMFNINFVCFSWICKDLINPSSLTPSLLFFGKAFIIKARLPLEHSLPLSSEVWSSNIAWPKLHNYSTNFKLRLTSCVSTN